MGRRIQALMIEASGVAVVGLLVGLAANALSPRGLTLTRDYFPRAVSGSSSKPPERAGSPAAAGGGTSGVASTHGEAGVLARLAAKGLQAIDREAAVRLFRDPGYEQEAVVFVDARDDRHYQEGHVPGAYQFDRYYPERYLAAVLPACLNASQVVVYCTGGDCEDSEFAALALREAGVPAERILIYAGGVQEWVAHGLPMETGARRSGILREVKP